MPQFNIILLIVVLWSALIIVAQEETEEDKAVQIQVDRQYNTPDYSGSRQLNIHTFSSELAQLPPDRAAQLTSILATATIPDIQRLFADGNLSTEELVRYYLQRIARYDADGYRSVLELNPDTLMIARQRDAERANGTAIGTLHGIPVLLKDNIATGDQMRTSAGAAALANAHADRDAFIVQRLRAAGAVILGKANLSEWANFMSFDSANGFSVLGGQTRNAYGRFDVGGSSAGSAVAVALNFVTVAIGTETSGSLIYPASQNSVVTLKPSLGLISRNRIIPIIERQDTAGPMTRTVTDLAYLLTVMAAIDPNDPQTTAAEALAGTNFVEQLDVNGLRDKRIGVVTRAEEVRSGDALILNQAVTQLEAAGATIVEIDPIEAEWDFIVYFYGIHEGVTAYLQATGAATPFTTLGDIVAFNAADPNNRTPFGQDLLELAASLPLNADTQAAYEQLTQQNATNQRDALLNALSADNLDFIADLSNYSTPLYAVSGLPAIHVPAGYRATGEPLGLTLMGPYLSDADLVAAAYALEQAGNVRQPPSLSENP